MATTHEDYMNYYYSLNENKEFTSLKTNRQRIEFILKFVRPLSSHRKQLFEMLEHYQCLHSKSDTKSLDYRQQGVKYFDNNDNKNAISMFKKAILCAPIPDKYGSDNNHLALSYAHISLAQFNAKQYERALRSADYSLKMFETNDMLIHRIHCLRLLRRFTEALQSVDQLIERCHNNETPILDEHSVDALIVIKRYIIRKMSSSEQSSHNFSDDSSEEEDGEEMKLSVEALREETQENNVWLHPSCQFEESERKGRYVIAKQFIPKGTVVLLERPTNILRHRNILSTILCCNCHQPMATIFPCSGCDEVAYCNKQCFETAYEARHKYECGFAGLLPSFGHGFVHTYHMINRVGIQKAFDCEEQNKNFDFEGYLISEEDKDFETEYRAYSSLVHHPQQDNFSNIIHAFNAIETALIFDYNNLLEFDVEKEIDKFVAFVDLILKNGRRVLNNVFGWNAYIKSDERPQLLYLGSCVCTISALLNHSCSPNIYWVFRGSQMVFTAQKDIDPGQEMCITYGPTHKTFKFIARQKKLKLNYSFDCNCEACLRECRTHMCVRCDNCKGPIVFLDFESNPQNERSCLHCGKKVNLMKRGFKIKALSKRFDEMIKNLENHYNIDQSLKGALNILESLMRLVYNKSQPFREYLMQLLRAFVRHFRFAEAVQCIEFFSEFIDLKYDSVEDKDSLSAEIVDELLLLTNCYYSHLIKSQTFEQNKWDNCFHFYEKLIRSLEIARKLSKKKDRTKERVKGMTEKLRTSIRKNKKELSELKLRYQSIATKE